ncbi:MAG: hypothetical protein [Circoviridae sp.]|nr:MAG: hypothetical protein [Circoviridae sp.]
MILLSVTVKLLYSFINWSKPSGWPPPTAASGSRMSFARNVSAWVPIPDGLNSTRVEYRKVETIEVAKPSLSLGMTMRWERRWDLRSCCLRSAFVRDGRDPVSVRKRFLPGISKDVDAPTLDPSAPAEA